MQSTFFHLFNWSFSLDALMQTIGGLIGAMIGAFLAYRAAAKQIKHERTSREIKEIENFLKSKFIIDRIVNSSAAESLSDIATVIEAFDLKDYSPYTITIAQSHQLNSIRVMLNAVRECSEQLKLINDDYIPQPVYEHFINIKWILEVSVTEAEVFINGDQQAKLGIKSTYSNYENMLDRAIKALTLYEQDQVRILKKLKK